MLLKFHSTSVVVIFFEVIHVTACGLLQRDLWHHIKKGRAVEDTYSQVSNERTECNERHGSTFFQNLSSTRM